MWTNIGPNEDFLIITNLVGILWFHQGEFHYFYDILFDLLWLEDIKHRSKWNSNFSLGFYMVEI